VFAGKFWRVHNLGYSFLPNPFLFIIRQSFYHPTPCGIIWTLEASLNAQRKKERKKAERKHEQLHCVENGETPALRQSVYEAPKSTTTIV
jgi:hypothetical protein